MAMAVAMGMAAATTARTGSKYTQAFAGAKPCVNSKRQRGMKLYCNSSQQLGSTPPLVLENLSEHAILPCRCNGGSLNRHIRDRTFTIRSLNRNLRGKSLSGSVKSIAGGFGSKSMTMLRFRPLQEHGRSLSKLSKENAYLTRFGQPRVCPAPLSALQDKTLIIPGKNMALLRSRPLQEHCQSPIEFPRGSCTRYDQEKILLKEFGHHKVCPPLPALQGKNLIISGKRSFFYLPVCRGRYLSKDTISLDESDVLQQDDETEIVEEGFGGLKENASEEDLEKIKKMEQFVVVNFYHFVDIEDAHLEVLKHMQYMQAKDIHGRIYINNQGINAQVTNGM